MSEIFYLCSSVYVAVSWFWFVKHFKERENFKFYKVKKGNPIEENMLYCYP